LLRFTPDPQGVPNIMTKFKNSK